jgi:hypothetical protein
MRLRSCLPAEATLVRLRRHTGWEWGEAGCEGLRERHLNSRTNFKLNRALLWLSGVNY